MQGAVKFEHTGQAKSDHKPTKTSGCERICGVSPTDLPRCLRDGEGRCERKDGRIEWQVASVDKAENGDGTQGQTIAWNSEFCRDISARPTSGNMFSQLSLIISPRRTHRLEGIAVTLPSLVPHNSSLSSF